MAFEPPSSRDKILDMAEVLFARRGFTGVGMQELAEASGLRKSSLFHHFHSKSQLYFEVLGRSRRCWDNEPLRRRYAALENASGL